MCSRLGPHERSVPTGNIEVGAAPAPRYHRLAQGLGDRLPRRTRPVSALNPLWLSSGCGHRQKSSGCGQSPTPAELTVSDALQTPAPAHDIAASGSGRCLRPWARRDEPQPVQLRTSSKQRSNDCNCSARRVTADPLRSFAVAQNATALAGRSATEPEARPDARQFSPSSCNQEAGIILA